MPGQNNFQNTVHDPQFTGKTETGNFVHAGASECSSIFRTVTRTGFLCALSRGHTGQARWILCHGNLSEMTGINAQIVSNGLLSERSGYSMGYGSDKSSE